MVYIPCSQTESYPRIKERFTTTNQHFHDKVSAVLHDEAQSQTLVKVASRSLNSDRVRGYAFLLLVLCGGGSFG